MSTTRTTQTLYLHTLDGKPAEFQSGYVYLATRFHPRYRITPATSLAQIRAEQNACCDAVQDAGKAPQEFLARCGYVLIEVPSWAPPR